MSSSIDHETWPLIRRWLAIGVHLAVRRWNGRARHFVRLNADEVAECVADGAYRLCDALSRDGEPVTEEHWRRLTFKVGARAAYQLLRERIRKPTVWLSQTDWEALEVGIRFRPGPETDLSGLHALIERLPKSGSIRRTAVLLATTNFNQHEVADTLGCDVRTVRRHVDVMRRLLAD